MSLFALAWQDHAVIVVYLAGMIALGAWLAWRQRTDVEYFLAGRQMPWFAVGMSVIASLLSSLTYLSEPGEVWNSGITHMAGKLLAIPLEVMIVWFLCIPFMMRFRFTSAYEYLEHRFGFGARRLGVGLFILMVVLWMGFVVLASSRALSAVSGIPLWQIISTIGFVATIYTMLGGLRAVIWTDVVQVVLLIGGGIFAIGFIAVITQTWLPEWLETARQHLADPVIRKAATESGERPPEAVETFSASPFVRVTIITVAINMCVWHVCTHTANQMTVQRYYSTTDMKAARRSFLTCSVFSVGLNLLLMTVGLAVLFYYYGWKQEQTESTKPAPTVNETSVYENVEGLNPLKKRDRDLVFPTFAVNNLPAGIGGAILAALLAAAMSSIDSGVNSIATVLSVERQRSKEKRRVIGDESSPSNVEHDHVASARWMTLVAGTFITVAAFGLSYLPAKWGIVDSMPRTFNAVTAPLGGLFLIGMFIPRASSRVAVTATLCGLATSVGIGYFGIIVNGLREFGAFSDSVLQNWNLLNSEGAVRSLSFTWVMPCAMSVTLGVAFVLSRIGPPRTENLSGLTWSTRHDQSSLTGAGDKVTESVHS